MGKIDIPYVEKDGILYPLLTVPADAELSAVGKYGLLWLSYMKENHRGRFRTLTRIGCANQTAIQVNEETYGMLDTIVNQHIRKHLPEKEVFMTEIMRKESNQNTTEGNSFRDRLPEILISIDHGWSSIKTPGIIFKNGIQELQTKPATNDNLLEYKGRKYVIDQGRMGQQAGGYVPVSAMFGDDEEE